MNIEIEQQILNALINLNEKFESVCVFKLGDNGIKVTNISEEIDKYEDAVPFHDKNCRDGYTIVELSDFI